MGYLVGAVDDVTVELCMLIYECDARAGRLALCAIVCPFTINLYYSIIELGWRHEYVIFLFSSSCINVVLIQ